MAFGENKTEIMQHVLKMQ